LCGRSAPESEVLRTSTLTICASCKPAYVQGLERGEAPARPPFRDLGEHTRWLRGLLIAGLVISTIFVITDVVELLRLLREGTPADLDLASATELAHLGLALLALPLWLGSTVLFFTWVYRAKANTAALGAAHLHFTPGWAVGWYFIPIANFWKPYLAMKELWQASHAPGAWHETAIGGLLPRWWTLWLLSLLSSPVVIYTSFQTGTVATEITNSLAGVASTLVDLGLSLAAIALTRRIWQAQERARAQLASLQ
jgi:hypothetical protein